MSWGFHNTKFAMRRGRELACLCLLLLLLLLLLENNQCFADEGSRFINGKKGSPSTLNLARIHQNQYKGVGPDKQGKDEVFGAEKRRVYTGPNPLHNR